jgi:CubicO group peptidase (beta-lactamase class C family)
MPFRPACLAYLACVAWGPIGLFADDAGPPATTVVIRDGHWHINGTVTYPGAPAEGLLLNVRMVNATFEDRHRTDFDADANTEAFLKYLPDYAAHGVRGFTFCLQGGMPGYEGALNSAFNPDGSLREEYLRRIDRVIRACDKLGIAVILGCYYQRQDQVLTDEAAVRRGVVEVARWIERRGYTHVVLEIANEFDHKGFDHDLLRTPAGEAELIRLAKETNPKLLVSASGLGHGRLAPEVCEASDFLLIHYNGVKVEDIPARIEALRKYGKPIICNEDDKQGAEAVRALEASVANGASWGLMLSELNQYFPLEYHGAKDDPAVYEALRRLAGQKPQTTTPAAPVTRATDGYFPPSESAGGWRKLTSASEIRDLAGMDPAKLAELEQWLRSSDDRDFAAVVIRNGYIVLEVERGRSAVKDAQNVKSCAKAICATVLAIASEESQRGLTPRQMSFNDRAFPFIPQAQPLSDPRKERITVRQLLNHTSGITPESTGVKNSIRWEEILGHGDDARTKTLLFDPGTDFDYGTHPFYHASLVCETVTGQTYDQFAIEKLLKPVGVETWWFEFLDGDAQHGRHPSHAIGLSARELARVAYCLLRGGAVERTSGCARLVRRGNGRADPRRQGRPGAGEDRRIVLARLGTSGPAR